MNADTPDTVMSDAQCLDQLAALLNQEPVDALDWVIQGDNLRALLRRTGRAIVPSQTEQSSEPTSGY